MNNDICFQFPSVPIPETLEYLRDLLRNTTVTANKINENVLPTKL